MTNQANEVCIVGLGPAGIGCALTFLKSPLTTRVVCLDAGSYVDSRSCSVLQMGMCRKEKPCQVISGFGGCSLIGAGRISAFPAGSGIVNILGSEELSKRAIRKAFVFLNNYLHLQKPKITRNDIKNATRIFKELGFQYKYYNVYLYNQEELREAYEKIFLQLTNVGIRLLLNTELININREENGFELTAKQGNQIITIFTKYLVLGVGRLGRSLLKSLNTKLNLGGMDSHLDVGVRVDFPVDLWPDVNKFHKDLKLLFNDARTFCVCRDGKILPYLIEEVLFTEGYLNPTHKSGFTNLGILLRLKPSVQNKAIYDEIKKRMSQISRGKLVRQVLSDYLGINGKRCNSYQCSDTSVSFWVHGDVNQCFPQSIFKEIRKAVRYFASRILPKDRWNEVNVFAPEVDYGGLCFPVNSDFSIIPRMYLMGDCTGRFRGILQAFCSGIICAESIIAEKNDKIP